MTRDEAIAQAKSDAKRNKVEIAIVLDPITNAEETGPYGYCPVPAVEMLFRFGSVVATVAVDGTVTEKMAP